MPTGPLAPLATEKYVRLTTFRRDGTPVATPVWVVGDGEDLLVCTGAASGKVKRLRHTPRVLLVPCDGRGKVREGAAEIEARGAVVEDKAQTRRVLGLNRRKYPFLGFFIGLRQARKVDTGETVSLRISPA
ncbi:MAG: PPOX class F420-dependent oxidoreductase [Kineosporiaceae bacterium]